MRGMVMAGVMGVCQVAVAQVMPGALEERDQVVCADQDTAIALAAAYENEGAQAEKLLSRLAERGVCERAVSSGKPFANIYPGKNQNKQRVLHVFEVDVLKGTVLGGKTKAFMLLYILHDNET